MPAVRTRGAASAVAAALVLSSCARATAPAPSPAPASPTPAPAQGAAASGGTTADFETTFRARTDSARLRFTPADVDFMTGMIAHHAQALVMAGLVPTRGASQAVRTLALRIVNSQQDEIATMQRWLQDRGQPVPLVHIEGTSMMVHGSAHAQHLMPGMLTAEQLHELELAQGQEFDRLFLKYMIQHHRGAVAMVHELFNTDGAGQDEAVFKFASDVQVDQTTEVARMERMLSALPAAGDAP